MIVGPGFEDAEFRQPYDELRKAGHAVTVLGTSKGEAVEGKQGEERTEIEARAGDCNPDDFDALVIPGGHGPDRIRTDEGVVSFVKKFVRSNKPIAAVCHGPQLLIEADAVRGKKMTSYPSVKTDLVNAGANWVDEEVVEDGQLITSRKPDDLEAFSRAILSRL